MIVLPIRTVSEANNRDHWAKKAKRVKEQRAVTRTVLSQHRKPEPEDLHVTVTRVYTRVPIADSDNLSSSVKAIRDEISKWLGIDDRDRGVSWEISQAKGKRYEVRITLTPTTGDRPNLTVW